MFHGVRSQVTALPQTLLGPAGIRVKTRAVLCRQMIEAVMQLLAYQGCARDPAACHETARIRRRIPASRSTAVAFCTTPSRRQAMASFSSRRIRRSASAGSALANATTGVDDRVLYL